MKMKCKGWALLLVALLCCAFSPMFGQTFEERKKLVDDYFQRSSELLEQGDVEAADEWMQKAMDVALQINDGNNITYASLEYVQAERLRNRDNDADALPLLEDAYARYRKASTLQTDFSVSVLQALFETNRYLGRNNEALRWGEQFLEGSKFLYGMLSEKYRLALYQLSDVHLKLRQYIRARQTLLEYMACLIKTDTYDDSNFEVCQSIMYLGYCEHELGNYDDAEDYYEMADSLFWANDKWKKTHVLLLNMRGVNFLSLGQAENADSCVKWSEELQGEIAEAEGSEAHSTDWMPKINRATLLMAEDPAKALEAFADILVGLEEQGDTTSLVYATAMANAGICFSILDDDETAVTCLESSIPLLREENNPLSENLLQALAFRAAAYEGVGNEEKLETSCRETSDFVSNAVTRAFPLLTERERAPLWNRFRDWAARLLPTYALDHQTDGLRKACYDAVLQSRGLLLNSSLNVEHILRQTTNPELKALYRQWMRARQEGMSSTTRELVRVHRAAVNHEVTLYGNVDYDAALSNGADSMGGHSSVLSDEGKADGLLQSQMSRARVRGADDSELQNAFLRLHGTKEEIERISSILDGKGFKAECRSGKQATERSVKDLSGRSPHWLHLATHGFYVSEEDALVKEDASADEGNGQTESSMLSRSALVMAGANRYLRDGLYDASSGDGFLTAYEMSSLDLSATDLVVMSACESGLGDIGSEGVFGLQRGVKKAGVHSILMTLSRVNDHATMLFMVAFYKGLVAGRTKMQALREAQKYIRTCEGGRWNAPSYWTPFVLLDDI